MPTVRHMPAPLLLPVLGWTVGLILAHNLSFTFLISLVAALCFMLAARFSPRLRPLFIILLFVALGAMRGQLVPGSDTPLRQLLANKHTLRQQLEFYVKQQFSSSERSYGIVSSRLAGKPLRANLIFHSESELQVGKSYRGMAELREISSDPLLDTFPRLYEASASQLGKITPTDSFRPIIWVYHLRMHLLHNLDEKLGTEAGWAKALLLSDTEVKTQYQYELRQSGTLHLIVVSGLHVWFLYLVLVSLFRIFLRKHHAELLFLPVILLFAALNFWAPSITRSIIMIANIIIAHQLQRPVSGAQSLSLSLFIITLIQPAQLFTLGLQLSFICVAVIMFGMPRLSLLFNAELGLKHIKRNLLKAMDAVLVSLLIGLAIAPLTLYHFGQASLNGIIGNLLGIPLSSALIPLSVLILLSPRGSFLCQSFTNSYLGLIWLWRKWITGMAALPFSLNGIYFNGFKALALAILMVLLLMLIKGKFRLALRLCLPAFGLMLVLFFIRGRGSQRSEYYVFAAGTADCSLIRSASGSTVLIDTGGVPGGYGREVAPDSLDLTSDSWAARKLCPWLLRHGISSLDYVIISHLHLDHCGGLQALASQVRIKRLIIPEGALQSPFWQNLQSLPNLHVEQVLALADSCSFSLDGMQIKFLPPVPENMNSDTNAQSLVCRVGVGGTSALFTGDISAETEAWLVDNYPKELACSYLKVPHHGSRSSSSKEFLQAAHPQEAWLTCNRNNRFGFPHPETLERYRSARIPLRSTEDGSIHILAR